jgi:peroxiredoxin
MTGPARVGPAVAPPAAGDAALDFTLRHTFDDDVNLRATLRRGPVVLAFYVFDFGHV